MALNSMRALLVHELQDLYGAEQQLLMSLPAMVSAAASPMLSSALQKHHDQTDGHVSRLEQCFTLLGETVRPHTCKGMAGLLDEGADLIESEGNPLVRDAGLIGAAQRVEHYEIAAYGTCVELAGVLGEHPVADLLRQTLDEERTADETLTTIALSEVNPKAMLSADTSAVR